MKNSFTLVCTIIVYAIAACNSLCASDVAYKDSDLLIADINKVTVIRRVFFNRVCTEACMKNEASVQSNTVPYIISQCSKRLESKDEYGIVDWHWRLKYALSLYFPYLNRNRQQKINDFMIAFDDYKKSLCDKSTIASAAEDICIPCARTWVIAHMDPHDFSWCGLFDSAEPKVGSGGMSRLQESMISISLHDANALQAITQKSSPKREHIDQIIDNNYSAPTTPIAKRVCH